MVIPRTTLAVSAIILLNISSALVSAVDFNNWSPPGPNDVRSPCPGLNTLANHGILPRNGKNLTIDIITEALKDGFNIGSDFSSETGTLAINTVSPDPKSGSFDLNDLNKHNAIEHDASLSRSDYYVSPTHDNHDFNQTIFDQVLAFYEGLDEIHMDVAAKAKYARLKFEEAEDRNLTYGAFQFVMSYGETALYLSTMGNPVTGVAPKEFVKILFEQERLPYREGWRPSVTEISLNSLGLMVTALYTASGEPQPEGLQAALSSF